MPNYSKYSTEDLEARLRELEAPEREEAARKRAAERRLGSLPLRLPGAVISKALEIPVKAAKYYAGEGSIPHRLARGAKTATEMASYMVPVLGQVRIGGEILAGLSEIATGAEGAGGRSMTQLMTLAALRIAPLAARKFGVPPKALQAALTAFLGGSAGYQAAKQKYAQTGDWGQAFIEAAQEGIPTVLGAMAGQMLGPHLGAKAFERPVSRVTRSEPMYRRRWAPMAHRRFLSEFRKGMRVGREKAAARRSLGDPRFQEALRSTIEQTAAARTQRLAQEDMVATARRERMPGRLRPSMGQYTAERMRLSRPIVALRPAEAERMMRKHTLPRPMGEYMRRETYKKSLDELHDQRARGDITRREFVLGERQLRRAMLEGIIAQEPKPISRKPPKVAPKHAREKPRVVTRARPTVVAGTPEAKAREAKLRTGEPPGPPTEKLGPYRAMRSRKELMGKTMPELRAMADALGSPRARGKSATIMGIQRAQRLAAEQAGGLEQAMGGVRAPEGAEVQKLRAIAVSARKKLVDLRKRKYTESSHAIINAKTAIQSAEQALRGGIEQAMGGVAAPLPGKVALPAEMPEPALGARVTGAAKAARTIISKGQQTAREAMAAKPVTPEYGKPEPLPYGVKGRKPTLTDQIVSAYEQTKAGKWHKQKGENIRASFNKIFNSWPFKRFLGEPPLRAIEKGLKKGPEYRQRTTEVERQLGSENIKLTALEVKGVLDNVPNVKLRMKIIDAIEQGTLGKLPPNARHVGEHLAGLVTRVGTQLANAGGLAPGTVEAHAMRYMYHYYEQHLPGVQPFFSRMLKGVRGLKLSKEEAAHFKKRKYETLAEARKAGLKPIEDIAYAFGRGHLEEMNALSKLRFFKWVSGQSGFAMKSGDIPKNFVKLRAPRKALPATIRRMYGELGEYYVHPDVAAHIEGLAKYSPVNPMLRSFTSFWKRVKVPWRAGAHVNQGIGNLLFLYLGDTPIHDLPVSFREMIKRSPMFREFAQTELLNADYISQHLNKPAFAKARTAEGLLAALESSEFALPKMYTASGLYRWSDLTARYHMYRMQRRTGKGVRPAIDYVNENFPNYRNVPQGLKNFENTTLGSVFLSFWYEALRIMGKHATTPKGQLKLAQAVIALTLWEEAARRSLGISAEEFRKQKEASFVGEFDLTVPFLKTKGGRPLFITTQRGVPAGEELEAIMNLAKLKPEKAARQVARQVYIRIANAPSFTLLAEGLLGREKFTGRDIWQRHESPWAKMGKSASHIAGEFAPADIGAAAEMTYKRAKLGPRTPRGARVPGYGEIVGRKLLGAPVRVGKTKREVRETLRRRRR